MTKREETECNQNIMRKQEKKRKQSGLWESKRREKMHTEEDYEENTNFTQ